MPIHGEIRHLRQHSLLAQQVGIPKENIAVIENGQVIEFTRDSMTLGEQVPTSYIFVDGSSVGEVDADMMKEREVLARDGIVLVNVVLDRFSGSLRRDAQISARVCAHPTATT
jgi:ribonuclease J